jgi:transposase-like protein
MCNDGSLRKQVSILLLDQINAAFFSFQTPDWVSAVKPDKTDQQATELLAAKSEILRLRAQLHRTEEERDILKKAARYFAKELE